MKLVAVVDVTKNGTRYTINVYKNGDGYIAKVLVNHQAVYTTESWGTIRAACETASQFIHSS